MAHQITAVQNKNNDWKIVSILNAAGEILEGVSVNRTNKKGETFPNFDDIKVGAKIEGQLWQSPAGKTYLFGPKGARSAPKQDMGPAANNAATAELKNLIEFGVRTQLTEIKAILYALAAHMEVKLPNARNYDYPEMDKTNSADAFDDGETSIITRADSPF